MGPRVVSTRRLYQMSDAIDTILGLGTSGKAEWGIFLLVHYRTFFSKFNCPFRNSLRHFFSAASSVASQWFDLFQRVFSIELGSPLMNPLVNGPVILASPARRVPGAAAQASAAATCLFVFFSLSHSLSLSQRNNAPRFRLGHSRNEGNWGQIHRILFQPSWIYF